MKLINEVPTPIDRLDPQTQFEILAEHGGESVFQRAVELGKRVDEEAMSKDEAMNQTYQEFIEGKI